MKKKTIFEQMMSDINVKPIKGTENQYHNRNNSKNNSKPSNINLQIQQDTYQNLYTDYDADTPDKIFWRANVSDDLRDKFQKRSYNTKFSIDLHGDTKEKALNKIENALSTAYQKRIDTLYIIHGKGQFILRTELPYWLSQADHVVGFLHAPLHKGGSGATFVYLDLA